MNTHCNVCGRETNSAGNCPVPHVVERFGLEAINHGLMVNVCRLRARVARLEGAYAKVHDALFIAWTQGDQPVAHPAHDALMVLETIADEARARGAVGE